MPTLTLIPQRMTVSFLEKCEERGLLKTLRPPREIERDLQADQVETLYSTAPEYGGHKMICVRKNAVDIVLTTHPEPEDVIFLNHDGREFKPLYLVMSLLKERECEERIQNNTLAATDLVAVRIEYNNPHTCMFTICGGIPHCEVTIPGHSEAPIFYVTEPAHMTMKTLSVKSYTFELAPSGH